ncbi:MAG: hypothetical protein WC648_01795 [Candidatus Paceibacterota bacterium]|jgi:hypothetical protein
MEINKYKKGFIATNIVVRGMTLVEVIIYCMLLSLLMVTFIKYSSELHTGNYELINEIIDEQQDR